MIFLIAESGALWYTFWIKRPRARPKARSFLVGWGAVERKSTQKQILLFVCVRLISGVGVGGPPRVAPDRRSLTQRNADRNLSLLSPTNDR